jgi:UDP-N-acetyl-D-galactosamine dehydrogenase
MGAYAASQEIRLMSVADIMVSGSLALVLGVAFKENCPDLRNTRVIDLVNELEAYNVSVDLFDPRVDAELARQEYGLELVTRPEPDRYDAVILAVAHDEFRELGIAGIRRLGKRNCILYDVKHVLPADQVDGRL